MKREMRDRLISRETVWDEFLQQNHVRDYKKKDSMEVSQFAGQLPEFGDLVDVEKLIKAYDEKKPDPSISAQGIQFGTSGHRGSSFDVTFNEDHIWAITQAICLYRKEHDVTGPLFLGFDTHALSMPAFRSAIEVLAANDVPVMTARGSEFTPTPVVSHAILCYNRNRKEGLADGIVITPSHNPPREGGFKYNPPHGGPAEKEVTDWIQNRANGYLQKKLNGVKKIPFDRAFKASTIHPYDFRKPFIDDLGHVIDMDLIRNSGLKIGVDPMGGAGVHYWQPIADLYRIDLSVLNTKVDPCFRFMTRDWDGQIRMDPSSVYAMQSLIREGRDRDISFACDTDHDRHGIVTKSSGLMPPNQYLSATIFYLFQYRPLWPAHLKIGKTLVSSQMIDRVAVRLGRLVYEVPVGFKWFVEGLLKNQLAFAGEESAGATFLRLDGQIWTTDKDGFALGLLAAEMTARLAKDPAVLYDEITESSHKTFYRRTEAPATKVQKQKIAKLGSDQISEQKIAGDQIENILTKAPGNDAPIGGFKIESKNGWIAARPSGTEEIYKIYAESFVDEGHLDHLISDG